MCSASAIPVSKLFPEKKIENAGGDLTPLSCKANPLATISGKEWATCVIDKSGKVRVAVLACCC